MNTSNPNIDPATDLTAAVPKAAVPKAPVPKAPVTNSALDALRKTMADQSTSGPEEQLDAIQDLRDSIAAHNQSASKIEPPQSPLPDKPNEKGQQPAVSKLIQPTRNPNQPNPNQPNPIQPASTQPASKQPGTKQPAAQQPTTPTAAKPATQTPKREPTPLSLIHISEPTRPY